MPQHCRILLAAVLLCGLAHSAPAAAAGETGLDAKKQEAVRAALAANTVPGDTQAMIEAAVKANALLRVHYAQKPGEALLTVEVAGHPECRTFGLEGGSRLIIDLNDTVSLASLEPLKAQQAHPLLAGLYHQLYSIDPKFITRIAVDLTTSCAFHIEGSDDLVQIFLHPKNQKEGLETARIDVRMLATDEVKMDSFAGTHEPARELDRLAGQLSALMSEASGDALSEEFVPRVDTAAASATDTTVIAFVSLSEPADDPLVALQAEQARIAQEWFGRTKQSAGEERVGQLAAELAALAAADIDLSGALRVVDAALDDPELEEAEEVAPPEETPDTEKTGDEDTASPPVEAPVTETPAIEPPPIRPEPLPNTIEANAELAAKILALQKALTGPGDAAPATLPADAASAPPAPKPYTGDPLAQLVNIDFREMELSNVVAILAHKAGINVIAGTDLTGMVTANLQNVPLRQALETALRMEGLGMIEEKGIYFIVPYEEAVVAQRTTHMISLENAKAKEVSQILQDITRGTKNQRAISITANDVANIVVVAGPENDIIPLIDIIHQLDIAEPVLPTITEPIKLNYASAKDMATMIEKMLSPEVGQVAADERARHLVVTDVPVVVEQVRDLITKLDIPVKQVIIDAMVVDVTLGDEADTGVQWILESVRRQSRRSAALDPGGKMVGNLQELAMATDMTIGDAAGLLNFGLLSSEINWQGLIQAEVRNRNGRLVSNPVLVTVENEPAKITIAQEIPYIELTQTQQGGQQTSTQFKEVGTVLEVTPSVTHDRHIILNLDAKESGTLGEFQGVPIEDKRSLETTLRIASGQTIFVGGLRKKDMDTTVRKVPVLGDIPVMNFLFRSNSRSERVNELLIFMTCDILDEDLPRLTTYQEQAYSDSKNIEVKTNAMGAVWHNTGYPREMQDPIAKWRRTD